MDHPQDETFMIDNTHFVLPTESDPNEAIETTQKVFEEHSSVALTEDFRGFFDKLITSMGCPKNLLQE